MLRGLEQGWLAAPDTCRHLGGKGTQPGAEARTPCVEGKVATTIRTWK
jgi:hypothetical protein